MDYADSATAQLLAELVTLRQQVVASDTAVAAYKATADTLQRTLEELSVAEEELRAQNEELLRTRELVEAERRRYQELFEFAPEGYVVTNTYGTIQEANRGAEQLLGVARERLHGKVLALFVAPEQRKAFRLRLAELQQIRYLQDWEVLMLPRHGQPVPVAINMTAVSDAHEQVLGFRWLIRDISGRKRAEEALQKAHEALEQRVAARTADLQRVVAELQMEITARQQAEEEHRRLEEQFRQTQKMEALGTLAGGIAHDFNNILAAIIGYTELTTYDLPAAGPPWQNLQEVLRAGRRARDLIKQILAFSHKSDPQRRPVSLPQLVEEALTLLRSTLPTTITIQQLISPHAGAILADPTQMHQVLVNLCANAEYAMRDSGGILEVRVEPVTVDGAFTTHRPSLHPGLYVRLTIRDTGHGIPPAVIERIFEPFFTTKGLGEGTGMGLAAVHGIITSHNGTITVESTPGQGTTFAIYLPRLDHEPVIEVPAEEFPLPGQGTILFVDDEVMLAQLGQAMLARLGYEVVACTSSLEALEAFRATPQRFDLVITDQTMPALSGEHLAQDLRRIRPDIPIILCTGYSHVMNADQALAAGLDAFCLKPLATHDLGRMIQQVLQKRSVPAPLS